MPHYSQVPQKYSLREHCLFKYWTLSVKECHFFPWGQFVHWTEKLLTAVWQTQLPLMVIHPRDCGRNYKNIFKYTFQMFPKGAHNFRTDGLYPSKYTHHWWGRHQLFVLFCLLRVKHPFSLCLKPKSFPVKTSTPLLHKMYLTLIRFHFKYGVINKTEDKDLMLQMFIYVGWPSPGWQSQHQQQQTRAPGGSGPWAAWSSSQHPSWLPSVHWGSWPTSPCPVHTTDHH